MEIFFATQLINYFLRQMLHYGRRDENKSYLSHARLKSRLRTAAMDFGLTFLRSVAFDGTEQFA